MARDYCSINFAGLTHDHSLLGPASGAASPTPDQANDDEPLCSAIAILKRHPMYDCLLLVKKYRKCLGGLSLEFPVDRIRESERVPTNESAHHHHHQQQQAQETQPSTGDNHHEETDNTQAAEQANSCARRRLVTRFLDGDDPMHRGAILAAMRNSSSLSLASSEQSASSLPSMATAVQTNQEDATQEEQLFISQLDDLGHHSQLVHVPINGLLDRLEGYTRSGVAVDGRVYAFAMGLKTAERMMTTKSMKELQETPI